MAQQRRGVAVHGEGEAKRGQSYESQVGAMAMQGNATQI